jgi:hypothetical protein
MGIHPAASRIQKLSGETPAELIGFDSFVDDRGESLVKMPLINLREKHLGFGLPCARVTGSLAIE